ncbi:MAG: hypothetical protein COX70_06130 [Flavobacteriales bacterium CG_4_10_14_0_2_um_filter_32_8]|nr:MAG: hypothetical protein COX70_06130 [Flavobacteriales bacterium CG_4_10_14_0_2_um_filter_32_8]PJB16117.1 MAG: hypothetical protein CO118_01060 [Flavobacteriales bacterium CG_4_9_14_3_um_filter_32_8]
MFSVCLRYAQNKEEAEDIFQQGFYLIYKNINQLKNVDALSGWIKRIFVNVALENNRKTSYLKVIEGVDIVSHNSLTEVNEALDHLATEELTALIQQLPIGCRKVFNLYVVEGFSHQEIAEEMKISIGTSKSQLHDARTLLKQKIINNSSPIRVKVNN